MKRGRKNKRVMEMIRGQKEVRKEKERDRERERERERERKR